jgi:antitoxin FitA
MARVLQVRDVPDEVHAELRKRAALAGVSLSEYALGVLERAVRQSVAREILLRAQSRPASSIRAADIVATLDDARDERDRR